MIVTVTLNVAVDKLYLVDEFKIGEITRVKECSATAGGKGLNVARVTSILQEEVIATGFIGGHSGNLVEEMLKKDGVNSNFIHVEGESRTCINIIDQFGKSTELLEPGVTVTEENKNEFVAKFKQIVNSSDVIVLSGSVPRGCEPKFYADLVLLAKENGRKVILDTSGENLRQGIKAKPTMIKPNIDEIKALLGLDVSSKEDVIKAARILHNEGVPYVAFALPIGIFIITGFLYSIPKELEEAACLDGCNIYQMFIRIIVPLLRPALATVAIFTYLSTWNELMFANTFINDNSMKTLTVGIMSLAGQYTTAWGPIGAGLVMATVPTLIFYSLLSNQIQKSLIVGAVKG